MDCDQVINHKEKIEDGDKMKKSSKNTDVISLIDEIKNDSGFDICDSVEIVKDDSMEIFNCESNDSVIDKNELPELNSIEKKNNKLKQFKPVCLETNDIPMPELIPLSQEESSVNNNVSQNSDSEELPRLFPIPTTMFESKASNATIRIENESRRSSTSSSLVDSLLNKFRRNTIESSSSDRSPQKHQMKSVITSDEDLLEEINAPFEIEKPSIPNMLPTPVVKNQRVGSAFGTSDEEYNKAIAKTKHKKYSDEIDKSKMTARSQPPKMSAPKMPTDIQQPRTLAEKRALINKNIDFLMIEQESKIYKQIQRKKCGMSVNYSLLETIVNEDIPINYGPWKALSWLRTKEGNYIQRYINIDGQLFKLSGSKGNHIKKVLPQQSSQPFPKFKHTSLRSVRCCEGGKIKKKIIDNIINMESIRRFVFEETFEPFKKLEDKNIYNQLSSIKPRPLSKKIECINKNKNSKFPDEDSSFLGDFSKFKMPDIMLQVTVQEKSPLDPVAKQYLNEVIPYRDLNENWINFSLSTLKGNDEMNKNFEFKIPYQNDKNHLLVREILKSKEDTEKLRILNFKEDEEDDMEWTFCKNANENDKEEMEVVEMIKDLTNSVFINLNDDLFTKDDECRNSTVQLAPVKTREAFDELSSMSKNERSKKVLLELRRLNANVVKTEAPRVDDEEDVRRHATAHLAKDEKELRATVIITESDTVLLSNKEKEARRRKILPKRYSDYFHDESEKDELMPGPPPTKKQKQPKELQDEPFKGKIHAHQKPNQPQQQTIDPVCSIEDLKTIRNEVNKWVHVNVELRKLDYLDKTQPWCMLHNLYKCGCKEQVNNKHSSSNYMKQQTKFFNIESEKSSIMKLNSSEFSSRSQSVEANTSQFESKEISRATSIESSLLSDKDQEISRRVLPVERKSTIDHSNDMKNCIDIHEDSQGSPKIEIVNISELINGGIGPIFMNIYDTTTNRLNQIFRLILNNKSALAYVDGLSYFIDMKRVDTMKLKFDSMRNELDHPVFILQPKTNTFTSIDSKVSNDFIKLLFDINSDLAIEIKDKLLLKQIGDTIESILQNVRKKIVMQFDSEPNEHVKEQLSMITRDRSNSDSSNSSTFTSPLHFDGKELNKAPEPGIGTPLMNEFNKIFSIRMQRLCAIIKSNTLGLRCLDGHNNKFYLYRWDLLLKSLEEELIQIWQGKLIGESGKPYYMMALTDSYEPPKIEHAVDVQNIKSLSLSSHMTELTRMILLKAENAKTKYMTILLYGCQGYFRICGIMNNKENYFDGIVAKPTHSTHPRLTAKIQKVYNIWYGLRSARESKRSKKTEEKNDENSVIDENLVERVEKKNQKETPENTKIEIKRLPTPPMVTKTLAEVSQISSYKWFLLNVSDDFSDVFIKQWNCHLPYKVIIESIQKAKAKGHTIQLIPNKNMEWPKIYALSAAPLKFKINEQESMSDNFLLFGPYLRNSNSYLLLMQNVNGKMYTRDYYEKLNGIKRPYRTRCLWIYANTLKCISKLSTESVNLVKNQINNRVNDDDIEFISDSDDDVTVSDTKNNSNDLKISTVIGGFQEVL